MAFSSSQIADLANPYGKLLIAKQSWQLGGTSTDFNPIASSGVGAYEIRVRVVVGAPLLFAASAFVAITGHSPRWMTKLEDAHK
jgi:hypothetical protein